MKTKIKTIDVNIYEWFDKTYGNSYFAGLVVINYGLPTAKSFNLPFQYGYGNHSEHIAFEELQKRGFIPEQPAHTSFFRYYEENKIIYRYSIQKNCKKRELMQFNDK